MIYKVIRCFLFLFDPEWIHSFILSVLSFPCVYSFIEWACRFEDPGLEREFFGIRFRNPVGLAAGFDKNGEAILGLQALGFGFIEVGTVTPKPQAGNPKPRILRLETEKAIVNWLGFNNKGVDQVVENIKKVKP